MRRLLLLASLLGSLSAAAADTPAYSWSATTPLGGSARWDYLRIDPTTQRLFIAHDDEVTVVDVTTNQLAGRLRGLQGAHGLALVPERGVGFVANGDGNSVTLFDLATLAPRKQIGVGQDPDSVTYDPVSQLVFVFNGESHDASVLTLDGRVAGTIALGGTPEFAVVDGRGNLFVNIETTGEIVRIDTRRRTITARYALEGCEEPKALAIDAAGHRLFSICSNRKAVIVDARDGRRLGTATIGAVADAAIFDARRQELLVANGEGHVTIIDAAGDAYPVRVEIPTRATGRTFAMDEATGALFIPAVDLAIDWSKRSAAFVADGLKLYRFERSTPR